jgi:putative tricarboxylic transport membrane protein
MFSFKHADRMELGVAVSAIVVGLFILFDSFVIKLGSGYDRIGPRFFPFVIATGLLVTGLMMLVEVLRGIHRREIEPVNLKSFGTLLLGLASCILLLKPAGFIIAGAVQFWLIARAFNSTRGVRDAVIAVILSASVYFIFTRGLGLVLPQGLLTGLF